MTKSFTIQMTSREYLDKNEDLFKRINHTYMNNFFTLNFSHTDLSIMAMER